MFETERLLNESFDKYTFIRDAYLQHRQYLITGEQQDNNGSLYVGDDGADGMLEQTPANGTPSQFPLTTAKNASHSAPAT